MGECRWGKDISIDISIGHLAITINECRIITVACCPNGQFGGRDCCGAYRNLASGRNLECALAATAAIKIAKAIRINFFIILVFFS